MQDSVKTPYNLIQVINSMPDELLKLSQSGVSTNTKVYKVNALSEYRSSHDINPKSRLWKKFSKLELEAPIKTVSLPEIGDLINESDFEKWSGVMEITETRISVYLDEKTSSAGVIFKDIVSALEGNTHVPEKKADNPDNKLDNKLTELVKSTFNHGFFLEIPEGLVIDKPYKIMVKSNGTASFFPLYFVTHLKNHSSVKIVFEFTTEENKNEASFIPMIHECSMGDSSELELVEIQTLGPSSLLFTNENIEASEKAAVNRFILDKGSQATQRGLSVELNQIRARAQVTGVYFPHGRQKFIYDTYQNHLASETQSDLLFKGVLDESADVLWKGNIFVKEGTKEVDGYQLSNTLLLSPNTHAESIPGLEISADDVKCSHGVTISSVDPEQLFYLQSRGITFEDSNDLVVEGFIHAAINRIKDSELQNYVKENLGEAQPVF
jgi:Fe-S cluster assembly protein SufD